MRERLRYANVVRLAHGLSMAIRAFMVYPYSIHEIHWTFGGQPWHRDCDGRHVGEG